MGLVFGDVLEIGQLLGFLETAEAERRRAGLRRDADHRRMRPVGGGDGGDEVGDAGAVLADADAGAVASAGVTVRHMAGALFVLHRDEADAGRLENVQCIHVGRADDAEDVGDAMGGEGLDEGFTRCHARHGGSPPLFL